MLPTGLPRIVIEAGTMLAWARYVGDRGSVIGLDRFGASVPYKALFEQFSFIVENIVPQVRTLVLE